MQKGVKAMEEARRFGVRPLLVVAAVLAVIATLWATGAFAAGGSSQSDSSANQPPGFVQDGQDQPAPSERHCPEGRGGSEGATPTDGADGSRPADV
jgi:hypothetical protein